MLDVRLFRDPEFGTGSAAITVVFLATFALFYLCVQYVQQVMGYSPSQTAFALSPLALLLLTFSALSCGYVPQLGLRAVIFASMVLVAVGFLCMRTLGPDSTFLGLFWPLLVISSGFGLCTAPTTSAIISAAPDQKQGVASAVNDATREVGSALGVATAGSILAGSYGHHIAADLAAFPEAVWVSASASLPQALATADHLGAQGHQLAEISKGAFVEALSSSVLVMAIIVGVAAVIIPLFAPGRDGAQLRIVRCFRVSSADGRQPRWR